MKTLRDEGVVLIWCMILGIIYNTMCVCEKSHHARQQTDESFTNLSEGHDEATTPRLLHGSFFVT